MIARLRGVGLVDDRAFADYWLENRALFKPRGARALRAELAQKGVARDVVDQAIGDEGDQVEDAYRAAERRAASLSAIDEDTFRQRLAQFLTRRGFGWETIEPAVERLWMERSTSRPD